MSKPFDLEAAKRGEPVEFKYGSVSWEKAYFIGPSNISKDEMVIEVRDMVRYANPSLLRMAPKTATLRYRVGALESHGGEVFPVVFSNDVQALEAAESDGFRGWLADWQIAEVAQ